MSGRLSIVGESEGAITVWKAPAVVLYLNRNKQEEGKDLVK